MMLSRTLPSRVEAFAYSTLIIGILGDHLSTSIALSRGYVMEANPMALGLMQQNLCVLTDILLIIVSIAATFISLRIMKNPMARATLILPIVVGLLRLAVTFWNVSLII